jgi:hypothetical protein
MPKLKSIVGRAHSPGGVNFHHVYETSVFANGNFVMEVPEDQVPIMLKIVKDGGIRNERIGYEKSNRSGKHQFIATQLTLLEMLAKRYAEWKVTGRKEKESRIYYRTKTFANYWLRNDGGIQPNGYDENGRPAAEGSGQWAMHKERRSHFDKSGVYDVGIGAVVCDRVTTTANTGDISISFERFEAADGTWAKKLNSWTHVNLWPGSNSITDAEENKSMHWLPYTEEHARFFHEAMLAVCKIAQRFDEFFGDKPADLLESISKGAKLLAAPKPEPVSGSYGDLGVPGDNHFDPSKRGFQPK